MGAILKQRKDLRTAKTLEEIELELWGGHGCLGGCNTVGVYNLCTGKKGCPCWCVSWWLSGLM